MASKAEAQALAGRYRRENPDLSQAAALFAAWKVLKDRETREDALPSLPVVIAGSHIMADDEFERVLGAQRAAARNGDVVLVAERPSAVSEWASSLAFLNFLHPRGAEAAMRLDALGVGPDSLEAVTLDADGRLWMTLGAERAGLTAH